MSAAADMQQLTSSEGQLSGLTKQCMSCCYIEEQHKVHKKGAAPVVIKEAASLANPQFPGGLLTLYIHCHCIHLQQQKTVQLTDDMDLPMEPLGALFLD